VGCKGNHGKVETVTDQLSLPLQS